MSKTWVNFKVLCGWSGCGHPVCVRLKVAEIAGLGVGRERGGGRHRQSVPGSHLALPAQGPSSILSLCLSFQEEASLSDGAPTPTPPPPAESEQGAQARRVQGTECESLSLRVGTTGVGQTVEVASRSLSGEAHKGIGISIQWEGPWPKALDTKGTWSAADPLSDSSVLSFDR